MFQHTAARRRLQGPELKVFCPKMFQHTAARRRLPAKLGKTRAGIVSTHSRAKAATGACRLLDVKGDRCFNTQPREGGCVTNLEQMQKVIVSTHSRAKAAAKV